jgi:hypothetical protein
MHTKATRWKRMPPRAHLAFGMPISQATSLTQSSDSTTKPANSAIPLIEAAFLPVPV